MSGYAFDLKGLEQTIANLDTTVRKVGDGANHVLREGAEIYKSALVNNTPVRSRYSLWACTRPCKGWECTD